MPRLPVVLALALAGPTVACRDILSPTDISTTYVLRTLNDIPIPLSRSHASTITLASNSVAVRRFLILECAMSETAREAVVVGTFGVRGTSLELTLRNGDYVWREHGELVGETITLRYPQSAGERDIVEVYQRQ